MPPSTGAPIFGRPIQSAPIFGKPLESAPIFGKPLGSAANILSPLPPDWRRQGGVSISIRKPASNQPLPVAGDSELEAKCASLQPLFEYLSHKMTDVMKVLNYSVAHIDVSWQIIFFTLKANNDNGMRPQ